MKKILFATALISIMTGVMMAGGGIFGIAFTYRNVARENITTPADASIPGKPVRGPLTLKAQGDAMRGHVLKTTNGKTYAEMPRQITELDANGNPVLDETGKPKMVPNTARDMWVTATSLITALNLGILSYAFSGLSLLLGCLFVWNGTVFYLLGRKF